MKLYIILTITRFCEENNAQNGKSLKAPAKGKSRAGSIVAQHQIEGRTRARSIASPESEGPRNRASSIASPSNRKRADSVATPEMTARRRVGSGIHTPELSNSRKGSQSIGTPEATLRRARAGSGMADLIHPKRAGSIAFSKKREGSTGPQTRNRKKNAAPGSSVSSPKGQRGDNSGSGDANIQNEPENRQNSEFDIYQSPNANSVMVKIYKILMHMF